MNALDGLLAGMSARRKMQREDEDAADRAAKRKQEEEDRAFTMSERARTLKLRGDMAGAAAPAVVGQAEQAGPVDPSSSIPAAAQPMPVLPTVQGKTYSTQDEAGAATAAYNSPQAVAERQAGVLSTAGEAQGAQTLRTGAMQERSARLRLNADERAELDARFNADLQANVNSWDSLEKFLGDSAADGAGGAVKFKLTASPDGKKRIVNVVGPDGTLKDTGQSFDNTPEGLQYSLAELQRMPVERKLAHLHNKAMLARQVARDAQTAEYQDGMLKATQDKTAAGIELAQARAEAARARTAAGQQPSGLAMADADKFINTLFTRKDEMTGVSTFDPLGANAVRGLMLRMPAAQQGDTQGAVNQALAIYQRAIKAANGDHAKAMQLIEKAAAPKPAVAPGSAPGAAPAPTPAAQPAAPIPASPNGAKAPPAAPEQPGMLDRIKKVVNDAAGTGREKVAIEKRLRDAANGGAPLTPAERETAKKFGIVPTI